MEEHVLDEKYVEILLDDIFLKIIIVRTSSPENNTNLLRAYEIPIPKIYSEPPFYRASEVLKIVYKLKDIEKDIDWNEAILGGYTSEAINFMTLLKAIAGKRNFHKLAYLVFNEMYI